MNLGGLENAPVEERLAIYVGFMIAATTDLSKVSNEQLDVLGYAWQHDDEAKAFYGEEQWNADFMEFGSALHSTDQGAYWQWLSAAESVRSEGLQIAVSTLGVLALFYGGSALVGALPATGTATGLMGAAEGIGGAQAGLASIVRPALAIASKVTGVLPSGIVRNAAVWGSTGVLASGTTLLPVALYDVIANADENDLTQLDAIAEADATRTELQTKTWADRAHLDPGTGFEGMTPEGISDEDWDRAMAAQTAGPGVDVPGATYTRPAAGPTQQQRPGQVPFAPAGPWSPDTPPPTGYSIDPNLDDPFVGGVPENYRKLRSGIIEGPDIEWGPSLIPDTGPGGYMYRDSDFEALKARMTEEEIVRFQDRMVRAGYMSEGSVNGMLNVPTVQTLERVLYESNVNGELWQNWSQKVAVVGDELAAEEDEKQKKARLAAIGPFQRRVYLEPDYATLAERSESAVEQSLGRPINDWEKRILVDQQYDDASAGFAATEQARLMDYESQVRAVEDDLETGDSYGGGVVQQVDDAARFQQSFDRMFENEKDRKDRTAGAQARSDTLMAGFNNAMSAIGGR